MNLSGLSRVFLILGITHGFSTQLLEAQYMQGYGMPPPSKQEVAETAAWFERLHWPDLTGKPFVELTIGSGGPTVQGFLFGEGPKGFVVFCTSASNDKSTPLCFTEISKLDEDEWPIVTRRAVPLSEAVGALVYRVDGLKAGNDELWLSQGAIMTNYCSIFVLARCCALAGRKDLADRLDSELLRLETYPKLDGPFANRSAFRNGIEWEIARAQTGSAIGDFNNVQVSRRESLVRFERIMRDYPSARGLAGDCAETLKMMIAEDEEHQRLARPINAMSADEKVRELIYRLRNQHEPLRYPDTGMRPHPDSPADQLVKMGPLAVPILLESLDDKRFTRRTFQWERASLFDGIVTVGDCALEILEEIAGRKFDREGAASWWKDFRLEDEKKALARDLRAGKGRAYRLAYMDPALFLEAAVARLRETETKPDPEALDDSEKHLISTIGSIESEEAANALRHEMLKSKLLGRRLAAAVELFRRGDRSSVPAVVEEWRKWKPSRKQAEEEVGFILFLGYCGDLSAMKALAEWAPKADPPTRLGIVDFILFDDEARRTRPEDVDRCAEEIGINALTDKTVIKGPTISRPKPTIGGISNPRVCDFVAFDLSNRWPERYSFDWKGTDAERDAQLVRINNTWRK